MCTMSQRRTGTAEASTVQSQNGFCAARHGAHDHLVGALSSETHAAFERMRVHVYANI